MRVSYVISDEETRNFDSTLYSYQRVVHEPHPLGGPVGEAVPIDSLVITRNGNQLKAIEDHAVKQLTYTGASDFYDGCTYSNEYSYNANGALDHDLNRDIDMILYDDLGNTRQIFYFDHEQIEYIYSADGTKLRAIYRPASSNALTDSTDYVGSLILRKGQPSMYMFDGGFVTFNSNGAIGSSRMHYYIRDYMGNNRMVVNRSGTTEQITHYYPYGGVIGDISTNESVQKYKFEGKELDRTFGLDNYDIHARQYFAMAPMWDRIDKMAENYYGISPYSYCGGDPVNKVDSDGKAIIFVNGFRIGVGCRDQVRYGYGDNSYPSVYKEDVAKYWDNEIVNYYSAQFDDDHLLFTSGSASPVSTAAQREEEGGIKALILDLKVSDGTIALDKDEPIRIVSHSQGGATAAGMAKTLLEYGYNVEIVEYITPHQATDFTHLDGVEGIQYDQKYDRVVSGQGAIEGVEHRFVDPSHFRSLLGGHANSDNKEIIKKGEEIRKELR